MASTTSSSSSRPSRATRTNRTSPRCRTRCTRPATSSLIHRWPATPSAATSWTTISTGPAWSSTPSRRPSRTGRSSEASSASNAMAPRPVIGICAAIERASWATWEVEANLIPRSYTRAVAGADAQAVILAPDDSLAQAPDEALDLIDGLVLAGGADIDPSAYGAQPHPESQGLRPERDRFELALAHRALERDLPVLGVCRGMELLNVALGGTLDQHLEGTERHRHTRGAFSDHEGVLDAGSLAERSVGRGRCAVKPHHHQAVDELGEGLVASGWSEPDGLLEALELADRRFALGVLWHPEVDEQSRVVGALVDAARERVAA